MVATPAMVVKKLSAAGASNCKDEPIEAGATIPNSFRVHQPFDLPGKPNGGQYRVIAS